MTQNNDKPALTNAVFVPNAEAGEGKSDAWFWGEVGPDEDERIEDFPDMLARWRKTPWK